MTSTATLRTVALTFISLFLLAAHTSCKRDQEPVLSPPKIIGVATFVDHIVLNTIRDSFLNKMKTLGYTKDRGWVIVIKSANGQKSQTSTVAEELIGLKPVVLVSISTPATKSVFDKNNGRTPHVYSFVSFPKAIGITEASRNTTGLSDGVDFPGCFQLIKDLVPRLAVVGMVYSDEPNAIVSKDKIQEFCKQNNVQFLGQSVTSENEVKSAVQSAVSSGIDVLFIGADSLLVNQIQGVVEVTRRSKIPTVSTDEGSVALGVLAALSPDYENFGDETAVLVDKVLKSGEADMSQRVEYIGKDLVLNLATARAIELAIPTAILDKATKTFDE